MARSTTGPTTCQAATTTGANRADLALTKHRRAGVPIRDARSAFGIRLRRVRDIEVESGSAASLPVVLELAIEMAAAECNDSVGPADGPEHAGLLEA